MTTHHSRKTASQPTPSPSVEAQRTAAKSTKHPLSAQESARRDERRWWVKLFLQPVLFLVAGIVLIAGLGLFQRLGWISSEGGPSQGAATDDDVSYICPMMCTPPLSEPGRCPVCAMELVPSTSQGGPKDPIAVRIDSAARRLANIQTASVTAQPVTRAIRTVGELSYDEGSLKTISAYVDGRVETLYADYTGMVVEQGDNLALLYSPKLYSAQVEYLLARRTGREPSSAPSTRIRTASRDLAETARERLIEFGMTAQQIEELEQAGQASSRLHLYAPNHGTVIEKLAVEGEYVREGDPIFRLADLSTVWLMLKLFPEDAASIRYGQRVVAEVQSLPGRRFAGRVAFVNPKVDRQTRTVGVRVVIPNEEGLLRAGDFARAVVEVPFVPPDRSPQAVYDPELAQKWISPRHPHVIESSPGKCRVCGVDLVPAARFGFTDQPLLDDAVLTVPRHAVLMAGENSVVYVETDPGRFEIRPVALGPTFGDRTVILSGVEEGDQVATRGNFLIDSQMQLSGNPSLIDPTKYVPEPHNDEEEEIEAALAKLSKEDRRKAVGQHICPVTQFPLGSMGTPVKMEVNDRQVFICCKACEQRLLATPHEYLIHLEEHADSRNNDHNETDTTDSTDSASQTDSEDRTGERKQGESR